jgi:hypothetical protein
MRLPRVRFKIWWLMLAVAIVAVLLAWFDVADVIAFVGAALVVIVPAIVAAPGRRLERAGWVVSLQPVFVLVYLYATWVTAWCVLGHRPRPSLDDPKSISPIVDLPYTMTLVSLMLVPICIVPGLILVSRAFLRRSVKRFLLVLILAFVWLSAFGALKWDPLLVLYWFMD